LLTLSSLNYTKYMPVDTHFSLKLDKFRVSHKSLYAACLMLLFWTLFDGVVSYASPLAITQAGYSETLLGFIIGMSSAAGAIFDFVLSKFLNNTHFRRVFLLMFAICFTFPLILLQAKTFWMFLLAMVVWGLYYDLMNFASYDFVGRKFPENEHSTAFGLLNVFKELGYVLAPLIAGLVIGTASHMNQQPFLLMLTFLAISIIFYLVLTYITSRETKEYIENKTIKPHNIARELFLWKTIGRQLIPVLILSMFFNIFDSFFWTLGPIISENYAALHPFNGLFLTAYTLPSLIVGWMVGSVTKKFGKKKTAFVSFMIGSVILSVFFLIHNPIAIIADIFLASFFVGFTIPAINGAYADYISETSKVEREIEALGDFFTNIGYIVGPIVAGILADRIGTAQTFSFLGAICAVVGLFLLLTTPKNIHITVANS
jgi:MFS family permease